MADKKVSQLTTLTSTTSEDLLLIIDDPNGTPVSKKITVKNLFGNISSNVTIRSSNTVVTSNLNLTTSSLMKVNNFIVTVRSVPASNNAASEGYKIGQMFFTNTHLYVAVNRTTLKRVDLSTF
jgi:hypothetical protein